MRAVEDDVRLGQYPREELLRIHEQMLLIRRFEEKAAEMYLRAKIGGYLHLNIGEEAAVVGSITAIQPQDYIFTYYRDHGHALARGMDPGVAMAELFGKSTGCVKGRGGSMHLFDPALRFMGGYAIVGGQIPLTLGVALAINYRGLNEAVVSFIGEGATNIGAFWESLNMAKLWHLPILFLCINNQYEMGTPVWRASAVREVWRKPQGYDIAGEQVDGMDVLAVREATERVLRRVREEKEPYFLEAVSYRYRGHSMADPARGYRTEEEVHEWMARDPINTFQQRLLAVGLATEEEFTAIQERVARQVDAAVEFADRSPDPDPSELADPVTLERLVYASVGGE